MKSKQVKISARKLVPILVLVGLVALVGCRRGDDEVPTPAPTEEPTTVSTPATAPTEEPTTASTPATASPEPTVEPAAEAIDEARQAQDGDTVSVHYVGTLDSGEEFDRSTEERGPITFVMGSGQVIPGFDSAVRGLKVGESVTVRIEAEEAYGEWQEQFVVEFPIEQAPAGIRVGERVQLLDGRSATVTEVTETTVTVDANHPLAGQALNFEIRLVSIQ